VSHYVGSLCHFKALNIGGVISKTACDIGLPVMLFVQVIHKAGSSSQVPVSDAHQGEAEVQAGDGPATEPQEEGEGHGEEEEGYGHTHFEGAIEGHGEECDAGLSGMGQLWSSFLALLTSMGRENSMSSVLHHFIYDLLM
jgi:hypothetical protein